MEIEIRKFGLDEWELFQKLNHMLFFSDADNDDDLDLDWPYTEDGINYYKSVCEGSNGIGLVAEVNKKPVGYIAAKLKRFGYRKSQYVEVDNIAVLPEYRSQGIGKGLMMEVQKWAKENNATRLYVEAFFGNHRAVDFYKEFGFTEIGLQLQKDI